MTWWQSFLILRFFTARSCTRNERARLPARGEPLFWAILTSVLSEPVFWAIRFFTDRYFFFNFFTELLLSVQRPSKKNSEQEKFKYLQCTHQILVNWKISTVFLDKGSSLSDRKKIPATMCTLARCYLIVMITAGRFPEANIYVEK